ncbi:MAG: DUF3037 domain-containing protein [Chitinispirillaceae bacterium]|nr:DUF3037 domain-containing protein [Chitinispirillaceae bacterium]
MNLYSGYYSLVQFCPNPARAEVANIGVIVFCPDAKFLETRLVSGNDRIRRIFGDGFDSNLIDGAKEALQARLIEEKSNFRTLDDLNKFIATRANDIRVTVPRFLKTEDPLQELENLFKEFVGGRSRKLKEKNPVLSQIYQLFCRPSLEGKIETKKKITLPFVEKIIEFPYAYRNGIQNLIQLPEFSLRNDQWYHKAFELAGEGYSIQKVMENGNLARKIIIIPIIEQISGYKKIEKNIHDIFMDHEIEVVESSEVEKYVDRVEAEAH